MRDRRDPQAAATQHERNLRDTEGACVARNNRQPAEFKRRRLFLNRRASRKHERLSEKIGKVTVSAAEDINFRLNDQIALLYLSTGRRQW